MNYNIIAIAGRQYTVQPGDTIFVDRLDAKEGSTIDLERVLVSVTGSTVKIGTPHLDTKLQAKVVAHTKAAKVRVAKFRSKSRYRRVTGHRHQLTQLEILSQTTKKPTPKSAKPSKTTTASK